MKHLLILLSLLLLSSPLFGQETGVLYLYESSSGFVLKSFGDGKVQPKYKGEITNGKPDGFGVLIYPYDGKSVVGKWMDGKEWNTKHTKKDGTIVVKYSEGLKTFGVLHTCIMNNERVYVDYPNDCKGELGGNWLGEIKDKTPNGDGIGFGVWGNKFVGKISNGFYWNGKLYSKGGNLEGIYENGVIDICREKCNE